MSNEREIRTFKEESYFDNRLSQIYLENGKPDELGYYLKTTSYKMMSGMTADEIDAVNKRAEEAYKAQNIK
ncbi:MAG: hypothetical protein FWB96_03095 [Defluviitaleaceae bacterium]|nr:hypothetical protein [Defluviitaleaceae bacterium]MCL2261878.1 hypothetical protein [Defluviitaleaceae bacterium]